MNEGNEAQTAQKDLKSAIEMQKKLLEAGSFVFAASPESAEGVWKVVFIFPYMFYILFSFFFLFYKLFLLNNSTLKE